MFSSISQRGWVFYLLFLLFIIFIFWIFLGRRHHQFIGFNEPNVPTSLTDLSDSPSDITSNEQSDNVCTLSQNEDICPATIDNGQVIYYPPNPPKIRLKIVNNNSINTTMDPSTSVPSTLSSDAINTNFTPKITSNLLPSSKDITTSPENFSDSICIPPVSKRKDFTSKGESICCRSLEEIFNKPFTRIRPDFLKNPETGYNLELDCYNDEVKIACEYNGVQHYVFPNYTGMSYDEFIKQVRRDELKRKLCDLHGIYLITVPYNVPQNMIKSYIEYYLPWNVQKRLEEENISSQHSQDEDDRSSIS